MIGLIGKKIGMTRVFDADGAQVPVTVLAVGPCTVLQCKTRETDGYDAVQLGYGEQKPARVTKARQGHCAKVDSLPLRVVREFRPVGECALKPGEQVTVDGCFKEGAWVDVTGLSKGKGFAGVMRRYHMAGGAMTHGGHSKRRPGSIGNSATPARVQKGKAMPGHMGHDRVTQRNLKVVKIDAEANLLLVRGAVPGPNGGTVIVREALKQTRHSE